MSGVGVAGSPFRVSGALFFLAMFTLLLPVLLYEKTALCTLFVDDAFYYFGVARNLAAGNGATFDGLHSTNGFHPLWMAVLVPIYKLQPDLVGSIRTVGVVESVLVSCGVVGIYNGLRESQGSRVAFLGAILVLAIPGSRGILRNGMESSLYFALLVLTWWQWSRHRSAGTDAALHWWLGLGGCIAFTTLARLEAIVLVPIALVAFRRQLLAQPMRFVALVAAPSVAVIGYVTFNHAFFGIWMPVSSLVKKHLAGQLTLDTRLASLGDIPWVGRDVVLRVFGAARIRDLPALGAVLYVGLILALVLCVVRYRKQLAAPFRQIRVWPILVCATVIAVVDLVSVAAMPEWYQVPILFSTALIVTACISRTRPAIVTTMIVLCVAVTLGRPVVQTWQLEDGGVNRYSYHRVRAGEWLRSHTAPDEIIGSWNGGMIGYFAQRHVINLDGLVNDVTYYREVVVDHRLCEYMDEKRISLLADQACGRLDRPAPYLKRFGCEGLDGEFDTVATFGSPLSDDGCPGIMVWRRRLPATGT